MFKRYLACIFVLLILFVSGGAQASTISAKGWGTESSGVYTVQLWTTDSAISITSVDFSKDSLSGWSWTYADDSHTSVILSGSETSSAGDLVVSLKFDSPNPFYDFSVEWAEVSTDTTLTGTNYYSNKEWTYTQGEISNTPTPIPAAVILFGGGISLLAVIRRKLRT
ncbi:hypothetical protein [Maridesulfovibrio sp.]|uniref:hypothetical protein n=1 Tax=Maridesulfovibrio sp. TaxID=2795000 RepID=UPI002A18DB57|nr:hypothetical protein [Maridesulfovibrio sp.]